MRWQVLFQVVAMDFVLTHPAAWATEPEVVDAGPTNTAVRSLDLERLWEDLRNQDARRAYQALCALVEAPAQTVSFLKQRLRAVPAINTDLLRQLIGDLESNHFSVRQKAAAELEKLGDLAQPALREAIKNQPPLEVWKRVEAILKRMNSQTLTTDDLQLIRAIEVLEKIGSADARQLLETLAKGAEGARLSQEAKASAERLARRQLYAPR
jgi:hypothetical protein